MKKFIFAIFAIALMAGCAIAPKAPLQVLTWEYIGDNCLSVQDDFEDLKTLKSWLDMRSISLPEAKRLVIARIIASDMAEFRKRQWLALIASIQVKTKIGVIDSNAIFVTASDYIDHVIEAYEIACE